MRLRAICDRSCSPLCRRRGLLSTEYAISSSLPKKTLVERRKIIRKIVQEHGLGPEWELTTLLQVLESPKCTPPLRFDALIAVQSILAEYVPEATLGSRVIALSKRGKAADRPSPDSDVAVRADGGLSKGERARVDQGVLDEAGRVD